MYNSDEKLEKLKQRVLGYYWEKRAENKELRKIDLYNAAVKFMKDFNFNSDFKLSIFLYYCNKKI